LPAITSQLKDENLIVRIPPPKLLIGHLLDLSGIGRLLPANLYHHLAIRNDPVSFYQVRANKNRLNLYSNY